MLGKGTTVHSLPMDRLVVESLILWWAMMPTKVHNGTTVYIHI